jgi:hypothetical protein
MQSDSDVCLSHEACFRFSACGRRRNTCNIFLIIDYVQWNEEWRFSDKIMLQTYLEEGDTE